MRPVRESIERLLAAHEPYPALVMDSRWNRLLANDGARLFIDGVAPFLLTEPVNALRLTLHPQGMAPRIANLAEWSQHMLRHLRRRISQTADPALAALYESWPPTRASPGRPGHPTRPARPASPASASCCRWSTGARTACCAS